MFQPHTYSRTRTLLAEFAGAFTDADHVIIVDIFRSRETPDPTLSAKDIVRRMSHKDVRHISTLAEAAEVLCAELKPGDILLTLGAGDGNWVGEEVLRRLNN
jgi:UDP-N-acetylmuramate--alanine ligase